MIGDTFYFNPGSGGFMSVRGAPEGSPAYTIAIAARDRVVDDATVSLPEGYDSDALDVIASYTANLDRPVFVPGHLARGLRQLGEQILFLDRAHQIRPPFTGIERDLIEHLVQIVPEQPIL